MKKNERRRDGTRGIETNKLGADKIEARRNRQTVDATSNGGAARRFQAFFEFGLAASTVATIFCAPEGAIRQGDFLPVAFWPLLFAVATFFLAIRVGFRRKANVETPDVPSPRPVEKKRFVASQTADFAALFFLFWALASFAKLVLCAGGDVRLSTNAIWTFATPTLLYFFVRYFKSLFDKRLTRNVVGLLIACAAAESAFATYSYLVVNPRLRAEYRADPDGVLAENGMTLAPGSRERLLFEKRLLDSSEPTGTFALANTLAGTLAPTFVLALILSGGAWSAARRKKNAAKNTDGKDRSAKGVSPNERKRDVATLGVWIATLFVVGFALVATKSRAGFLATLFGLGIGGAFAVAEAWRGGRSTARRTILTLGGAALFVAVLLGAAFATGILDAQVFLEAGKSLGYRLDYWRASAAIVRDFPWLGIGPGEFQNVYPQYVAATASEFVADPHHFAFELATLFGVPALGSFLAFLGAVFFTATRRKSETDASPSPAETADRRRSPLSSAPFWGGAFFGIVLAFCSSIFQTAPLEPEFAALAAGVFAVVLPSFRRLTRDVESQIAVAAALAAALLNLCAAGGIGYPAISAPLFLLAAFLVNHGDKTTSADAAPVFVPSEDGAKSAKGSVAPLLVAAAIFIVFYATALRPRFAGFLFENRIATPDGAATYREAFAAGAPERVDGRSASVVSRFYGAAAQRYFEQPTPENELRWKTLRDQVLRVSPNSASFRENCGDFDFALFKQNEKRREFLESATDFYREATEKSPTETGKRTKFVRASIAAGKVDEARNQAKIALELDAQTPHLDRKLSSETRAELERFLKNSR